MMLPAGTSDFIVAPFPILEFAPISTPRFTVTPIPTREFFPMDTSPANTVPGEILVKSFSSHSCETMAPVLMITPKPILASLPTYACGKI